MNRVSFNNMINNMQYGLDGLWDELRANIHHDMLNEGGVIDLGVERVMQHVHGITNMSLSINLSPMWQSLIVLERLR